jgi:hypothetical protein
MRTAQAQLPDVSKWGKRTETLAFSPVDGTTEVRWSARYKADQVFHDSSLTLDSLGDLDSLEPVFKCAIKSLDLPLGVSEAEVVMAVAMPMAHRSSVVRRQVAALGEITLPLDRADLEWVSAGSRIEVRLAIVSKGSINIGSGVSLPSAILAEKTYTISLASDDNGFRTTPTTPAEFVGLGLPADTPFWVDIPSELDLNQPKDEAGAEINVRIAASIYKSLSRPGADSAAIGIAAEVMAALVQAGITVLGSESIRESSVLQAMLKKLEAAGMSTDEVRRTCSKEPERLRAAARAVMSPSGTVAKNLTRMERLIARDNAND